MRYFALSVFILIHFSVYSQKEDTPFFHCIFPISAEFSGGNDSLKKFIVTNFNQPDAVPDSSFSKSGIMTFVIDKHGKACRFKFDQCLDYDCDEEIIRILKLTKWKPARSEGKLIEEYKRLPITLLFEKSALSNSSTSPQSAPCAPLQTPLVIS